MSYSAVQDPDSPDFDSHRGYEADLLSALEAIDGARLSFSRKGVAVWDGIWLLPAGPRYDIVGGGITILETRTRDASGKTAVVFTSGHIEFRHSLLVRSTDARRLVRYRDLAGADRVGVVPGTTGEARLLELTGIADPEGVLAAGTKVETPKGAIVADGGTGYVISAAAASKNLSGRLRLRPASADMPRVVYRPAEPTLIEALAAGQIDAIAKDEIGNRLDARASGGAFAVTAVDGRAQAGGFALAARDTALAACLDRHIARLTDNGRIGYREWLDDRSVFMRRARQASAGKS
ncbi:MAG: transporter substrate-binding domain-containing protein [Defluviicoccus sp.]|nr:transporter substrate-binding domain-containing protein [Defluviicoccus sp.]MDE0383387.1 transporter substrate-binding domain-containing protein [Defluviicoccus sp.]